MKREVLERMRRLEAFGVGAFTDAEIAAKCAEVRALMERRPSVDLPRITVVLPAYQEERYMLATLRSLAEQTHPSTEFLVISNGEPEGNPTQRIAEACGFRVLHDPVPGISRARQTGLEAARGDIVVSTDADTLHPPGWLDRIDELFADPRVLCGAGLVMTLSPRRSVRLALGFISWTMWLKSAIHPRFVTGMWEANSFCRRDLALAAGGYDPEVRVGEGIMLFRHIRRGRTPLVYADPQLRVCTSGRRQEHMGGIRWLWTGIRNVALQVMGGKGVGYDAYPDIR